MNWFKLAQNTIMIDPNDISEYLNIGHPQNLSGKKSKAKNMKIWFFDGQKIITLPTTDDATHGYYTRENEKFKEYKWKGRYDEEDGEKRVSIFTPYELGRRTRGEYVDIPQKIIRVLEQEFGTDINIYIF
ncbi:MAG: hypothetical protein WDA06_07345 [Phenylobacterium sp.]